MVIVHKAVQFGGPGGEIGAIVAEKGFDYLDAPIARIAAPFCPIPFSSRLDTNLYPKKTGLLKVKIPDGNIINQTKQEAWQRIFEILRSH